MRPPPPAGQHLLVRVFYENGNIIYYDELTKFVKESMSKTDLLKPLFCNGEILRETNLEKIRNKVKGK